MTASSTLSHKLRPLLSGPMYDCLNHDPLHWSVYLLRPLRYLYSCSPSCLCATALLWQSAGRLMSVAVMVTVQLTHEPPSSTAVPTMNALYLSLSLSHSLSLVPPLFLPVLWLQSVDPSPFCQLFPAISSSPPGEETWPCDIAGTSFSHTGSCCHVLACFSNCSMPHNALFHAMSTLWGKPSICFTNKKTSLQHHTCS